jgi:hypothetical protein
MLFVGCCLLAFEILDLRISNSNAQQASFQRASDLSSVSFTNSIHDERAKWFFQQRAFPLDDIPSDALLRAWQQIQKAKRLPPPPPGPDPIQSERWVNIGPAPLLTGQSSTEGGVSGRVTEIGKRAMRA